MGAVPSARCTAVGCGNHDALVVEGHEDPMSEAKVEKVVAREARRSDGFIGLQLRKVVAEEVGSVQNFFGIFDKHYMGCEDKEKFKGTVVTVSNLLADGVGGAIIAVVHESVLELGDRLAVNPLDDGQHTECFKQVAGSLEKNNVEFKSMIDLLTAHNDSDRWEQHELEQLVIEVPAAAAYIGKLSGQPKDGAIIINHEGIVRGACLNLKYPSKSIVLVKSNGTAAGTRHASSLGFAEWLGETVKQFPSIVFTRSDGGGAHAFLPCNGSDPRVVMFDTLRVPDQDDMLRSFKARIMSDGQVMCKTQPSLARHAIEKERIVTVVSGKITSDRNVENAASMVLRANTIDQELYVLPNTGFEKSYLTPGMDLDVLMRGEIKVNGDQKALMNELFQTQTQCLISRGFKLYQPRPDAKRWVYELQEDDFHLLPTKCFFSAWGATQHVAPGDYLAMIYPEEKATDIYLMPAEAVATLEECSGIQTTTQEDMLSCFKKRITEKGKLMVKTGYALIRQAEAAECMKAMRQPGMHNDKDRAKSVGGQIGYETMWVVRNCPNRQAQKDSLIIRDSEYTELWQSQNETSFDSSFALNMLLTSQGYRWHKPKPNSSLSVYAITADDLKDVPTKFFINPNGQRKHLKVGDFLSMPSLGNSVDLLTKDAKGMYSDATAGANGR